MIFLFHFSERDIQLGTRLQDSLPVRHPNKLPCLLLPFTVIFVYSDITSPPIYHLTLACNHFDTVLINIPKIYCRVERLCIESLMTI